MNTFGPYVLSDFNGVRKMIAELQPTWIVLHDGEAKLEHVNWLKEHCPNTSIVLRLYESDSWFDNNIRQDPIAAANHIASRIRNHDAYDSGCYWITSNEVCQDWSGLPKLNAFYVRLQEVVYDNLILGSFSVENIPWSPGAPEGWHDSLMAHWSLFAPAMENGLDRGDILGVHQYNAPRLINKDNFHHESGVSFDALRIFRYETLVWPYLPERLRALQVLISEFGWDQLLWPTHKKEGVLSNHSAYSVDDAGNQLVDYLQEHELLFSNVPIVGRIAFCVKDSGGWDAYRWDKAGGNLDIPLFDHIIQNNIGLVDDGFIPPVIPPEPPITEPEEMTFDIYDSNGNKQDAAWLKNKYGNVYVTSEDPAGKDYFKLVALYEGQEGESGFKATVLTLDENPDQGRNIAFHWTGAEKHDSGCATWPDNRFDAQATNHEGHTAFGMGNGSYYWPPNEEGAHKSWVCSKLKSDVVHGIGMLSGTNHEHMDAVWQRVKNVSPPVIDPDPPVVPSPETPCDPCNTLLISSYTAIIEALIAKLP